MYYATVGVNIICGPGSLPGGGRRRSFFYLSRIQCISHTWEAPGGLRAPHVVHSQVKLAIVNAYFISNSSVHCIPSTSAIWGTQEAEFWYTTLILPN